MFNDELSPWEEYEREQKLKRLGLNVDALLKPIDLGIDWRKVLAETELTVRSIAEMGRGSFRPPRPPTPPTSDWAFDL